MQSRPTTPRTRSALKSVHQVAVQIALESIPFEAEGEMEPRRQGSVRGREQSGGERNGIPHRAANAFVQLPDESDVHQRRP